MTAKLSCSTYAYSQWNLAEALASIARVGYRGVEILTQRLRRPGSDAPHYHLRPEWPDDRIAAVEDQLGRLDLQVVALSPSTDMLKPRRGSVQAEIDEVCAHIDLAIRLGAPLVRPFATSDVPAGMSREAALAQIADAFRPCAEYAASKGVRIAIENHGRWPGEADNMIAILEAVRSEVVGLTLHIPRETAEQLIAKVSDKIWHLHLSDTTAAITARRQQIQALRAEGLSAAEIAEQLGISTAALQPPAVALGDGETDIPGIVQALRATNYTGWYNHEGPPEPNPEPTERRSIAYLRQVVA